MDIATNVQSGMQNWEPIFRDNGVSAKDIAALGTAFLPESVITSFPKTGTRANSPRIVLSNKKGLTRLRCDLGQHAGSKSNQFSYSLSDGSSSGSRYGIAICSGFALWTRYFASRL